MMTTSAQTTARQTSLDAKAFAPVGLPQGVEVFTLKGITPIEALRPGDRIVTREGARSLRNITLTHRGFNLEFDRPQIVLLAKGQAHSDTGAPFAA